MMSMNRELNSQLFLRREEQQNHEDYNREYGFYDVIAAGDIEAVKNILVNPENVTMYERPEFGRLSKDSLRNIRYHFVVATALITRLCVEKGLERELAYTLSDLYISKMDCESNAKQIFALYNELLLDFTRKMAELPRKQVYSIQIVKAMEYIFKHRNERITVQQVADSLRMNRSYLSSLFIKETGESISEFVRKEKVKAAANMLKFSEYSYSDIAEYFGFASQSHFIQCFKKQMGLTPKEYRNKYARSQSFS